jgi:hypothetical protein
VKLASIHQDATQYEQAEQLLREAHRLRRTTLGDVHPKVTESIVQLAQMFQYKEDFETAEIWLRQGRKALQEALPAGSWRIAQIESMLGACLVPQGQDSAEYVEAESLLVSSYEILRAAFGTEHTRTQQALKRIIGLYEAWGKPKESAKYRSLILGSASLPSNEPVPKEGTSSPATE